MMPRPAATKKAACKAVQFQSRLSPAEELSVLKKMADHLRKNPAQGHALLVRAGIYTKGGKLTKAYGG